MKIEDNTHWDNDPCIYIEKGHIYIEINKHIIEITCDCDYGGKEFLQISTEQLLELLFKLRIIKEKK